MVTQGRDSNSALQVSESLHSLRRGEPLVATLVANAQLTEPIERVSDIEVAAEQSIPVIGNECIFLVVVNAAVARKAFRGHKPLQCFPERKIVLRLHAILGTDRYVVSPLGSDFAEIEEGETCT